MRAVVQRVHQAAVQCAGVTVGAIDAGLLVYLGVARSDDEGDARALAEKVRSLRIFPEGDQPLHRDVGEIGGRILVVSAFTTQADARKGRRPALNHAAPPAEAERLYERFCAFLRDAGITVATGRFREHMDVTSSNDGPICVLLDSGKLF
jgi:D-tyrosyl-tRNA(Tyr) deacylase